MQREPTSDARWGGTPQKIFLFARGRGRAHAMRAMEIAAEVQRLRAGVCFTFVSYGTGAETFRKRDIGVIDLDIPDPGAIWPILVRAGRLMRENLPDLVLSCEEFAALPAAKITSTPTVFIGDWFIGPRTPAMQALVFADEVIFAGDTGIFEEPPYVRGKVHYAGPLIRTFSYLRSDRERARSELGLATGATVVLVVPGDRSTEQNEPLSPILMPAFDALPSSPKQVVWVAGRDNELLRRRFAERPDVIVKQDDSDVDRLMAASDLAVTKGDHMAVREFAALGIPSISISYGRNPVDDAYARRISSNVPLEAALLSPAALSICMRDSLSPGRVHGPSPPVSTSAASQGLTNVVQRILHQIDGIKASRKPASPA